MRLVLVVGLSIRVLIHFHHAIYNMWRVTEKVFKLIYLSTLSNYLVLVMQLWPLWCSPQWVIWGSHLWMKSLHFCLFYFLVYLRLILIVFASLSLENISSLIMIKQTYEREFWTWSIIIHLRWKVFCFIMFWFLIFGHILNCLVRCEAVRWKLIFPLFWVLNMM